MVVQADPAKNGEEGKVFDDNQVNGYKLRSRSTDPLIRLSTFQWTSSVEHLENSIRNITLYIRSGICQNKFRTTRTSVFHSLAMLR